MNLKTNQLTHRIASALFMLTPLAVLIIGLAIVLPPSAIQAPVSSGLVLKDRPAPRFSGASAYGYLATLVGTYPHRVTGSERYREAAGWARDRLKEMGLAAHVEEFQSPITFDRDSEILSALPFKSLGALSRPVPGWNVVAELPGREAGTIVVGAHLDIVPETVEGANDDGSGVCAVLELARVLRDRPRRHRFLFILFDREEKGMLGSQAFVRNHPELRVDCMLALDEVGAQAHDICMSYYPATRNGTSPPASIELLAAAAQAEGYAFTICPKAFASKFFNLNAPFPGNILIDRSTESGHTDFSSFMGRAAVSVGLFTWSSRPTPFVYHTPSDTIAAFDPASLERAGRVAERYLAAADSLPASRPDPLLAVAPLAVPWGYGFVSGGNVLAGLVVCLVAALTALAVAFYRSWRAIHGIGNFLKREWSLLAMVVGGPLLIGGLLSMAVFLPLIVYVIACVLWMGLAYFLLSFGARRLRVDPEDIHRTERRRFTAAVLFGLTICVWSAMAGPFAVLFIAGPAIFIVLPSCFRSAAGRWISKGLSVLAAVYALTAGLIRVFYIFNESGIPGMATVFTFCLLTVTIGAYMTTMPRTHPGTPPLTLPKTPA
jgi:hypothetical protein